MPDGYLPHHQIDKLVDRYQPTFVSPKAKKHARPEERSKLWTFQLHCTVALQQLLVVDKHLSVINCCVFWRKKTRVNEIGRIILRSITVISCFCSARVGTARVGTAIHCHHYGAHTHCCIWIIVRFAMFLKAFQSILHHVK